MKYQFKNAFDTIMIDRLTGIPEGAKILVYRLAFTAILLAEKYGVHFVTDDPEAKKLFDQTVIGNGEFGNDDKSYLIEPSEEINKKENEKAWLDWSKSLDMQFSGMVINPPYAIGNKIIAEVVKHLTDDGKAVVIQPLSQYKNQKLFENIESFELTDPKIFEDAAITKNLCICTNKKAKVNKYTWSTLLFNSFDKRYIKFYQWNVEHNIGLTWKGANYKRPEYFNIDIDFVDCSRWVNEMKGSGYHPKTGFAYAYNVIKNNFENKWGSDLAYLRLSNKQAKDNYCKYAYNYSTDKRACLASKTAAGLFVAHANEEVYMLVPQIDWETIDQHPLWNTDVDAAVLDVMGLKWNEDKTVIIDK